MNRRSEIGPMWWSYRCNTLKSECVVSTYSVCVCSRHIVYVHWYYMCTLKRYKYVLYYVYSKSCLILFCLWINRYDILPVTCVETAVFGAKDLDNPGHHWMVIDSDYCPWPEEYDDHTYTVVRIVYSRDMYTLHHSHSRSSIVA